jgi:hypothetical protein
MSYGILQSWSGAQGDGDGDGEDRPCERCGHVLNDHWIGGACAECECEMFVGPMTGSGGVDDGDGLGESG